MNSKYKMWVTLSLIAVFALGVVVGIFGGKMLLDDQKRRPRPRQEPFPTLEVISKELQLTSEQEAQIREAFKRSEERFQAFGKEVHGRLAELREQLKTEVDAVLTQEQEKKMQELMEKHLPKRRRESSEQRGAKPKTPLEKENKGEKR
jgi:Spy/CpxP family protein refolding chaperone